MGRARANAEVQEQEIEKQTEDIETEKEIEAEVQEQEIEAEPNAEYIIEAPNKSYTGTTATVDFEHGIGKTKNLIILDYFKARGYKVSVVK